MNPFTLWTGLIQQLAMAMCWAISASDRRPRRKGKP